MAGRSLLHPNSLYKIVLLGLLLVPFCAASNHDDWKYENTRKDSRDFVSGGTLRVHMKVGDLHIKRGTADKIRLEYTVKSRYEHNVKEARVDFDVRGNEATIDFQAPSTNNTQFDVELEVPPNTNLDLHSKVGDVSVDAIEGDKDIELGVGDIRLAKAPSDYRYVKVSSGIGDVNGDVTGNQRAEVSGWLGKTLKYHGDGKYELRARVGVGDINLDAN
ncbi:MAG TPA: hypothetical protein VMH04_07660 [Candidatus Solibacter sp.]|nr:hypothetical protein [Candidatus Solibacter sp.]